MKLAQKHAELREVECMTAIARAHKNRNLADFEKILREYHHGVFIFYSTCFISDIFDSSLSFTTRIIF